MIFRRRARSAADAADVPARPDAPEQTEPDHEEAGNVIDLRDEMPAAGTEAGSPQSAQPARSAAGNDGTEPAGTTMTATRTGTTDTTGIDDDSGQQLRQAGDMRMAPAVDRSSEVLLQSFTDDLAESASGIAFIYRSLERLAERVHADDAVLVVDNADLGRQAFRAGRRPIESSWGRDVVRTAPAGLHLLGSTVEPGLSTSVANLSSLALRLDVATHDSLHDPLTSLLNRRSFDEQLDTACSQSDRYGWRFALVLIDLDSFKSVNDRLGHQAGDTVLRAVGAELRSGLRAGDAAARVGGDEFALVLPNADESLLPSLLERLRRAVLDALPSARVGLSAGLAIAPEDGTDPTSLFRMADQRLYEAKAR